MTQKQVMNQRDEILFGEPYDEDKYRHGGIRRFENLDLHGLHALLDLGAAEKKERQNRGPTIQKIASFLSLPGMDMFRAAGYAVCASRCDCRVTLDAVYADEPVDDERKALFAKFARRADEFELDPPYAWWD